MPFYFSNLILQFAFYKNRMKRIEKQNKCFSKQEKILLKKRRKSLLTLSFHSIIKKVLFTGV